MARQPPIPGIHNDIHDGTFLQEGVSSIFRSFARRRGIIEDFLLPGTNQDSKEAIIIAVITAGPFHHADTALPLSHVRSWKFGKHAYVEMYYQFTRASFPPAQAATLAQFDSAYDHILVYRHTTNFGGTFINFVNGLPAGQLNDLHGGTGLFEDDPPTALIFKRPSLKIIVPTVLATSPYILNTNLANLPGTTNSGAVSFNNILLPGDFGPEQVRYDGCRVIWEDVAKFRVTYHFTAVPIWRKQEIKRNPETGPFINWDTKNEPIYPTANFAGTTFPVHQ